MLSLQGSVIIKGRHLQSCAYHLTSSFRTGAVILSITMTPAFAAVPPCTVPIVVNAESEEAASPERVKIEKSPVLPAADDSLAIAGKFPDFSVTIILGTTGRITQTYWEYFGVGTTGPIVRTGVSAAGTCSGSSRKCDYNSKLESWLFETIKVTRMLKKALLVSIGVFLGPTSALADVGCQGLVSRTLIQPEGTVYADFGFGRTKICELNGNLSVDRGATQGGVMQITPTACQALLTSFLNSKTSGRSVTVYIARSDCALVDGALPVPYPYMYGF